MSRPDRSGGEADAPASTARPAAASSASRQRSGSQPCYNSEMVARALPRSRPTTAFNGVKVFSATKHAERDALGDRVTLWLREHPAFDIVDVVVTQSSDAEFHCVTITVFYLGNGR